MAVLDNKLTSDAYTPALSLRFEPSQLVTVTVTNNPVFAQFAVMDTPGLYASAQEWQQEERRMLPSIAAWSPRDFQGKPIVGVRLRSAVIGQPAYVTVSA